MKFSISFFKPQAIQKLTGVTNLRLLCFLCLLLCGSLQFKNEDSFSVWLKDPLKPDADALEYTVYVNSDKDSIPLSYRMLLAAQTCSDNTCKPLKVVLYWDEIGRFLRLEPVSGFPLTKTEKEIEFSNEDYEQLSAILKNTESVLNGYQLGLIKIEETKEVDAISGATESFLKDAVVPGALYTTWVLWHRVNGSIVEQLKAHTAQIIKPTGIKRFLLSDDQEKVRFALKTVKKANIQQELIFKTFEKADRNTTKSVLQILEQMNVENLNMKLVLLLGTTGEEAEWEILDFIQARKPESDILAALKERMKVLTFIGKLKAKRMLEITR